MNSKEYTEIVLQELIHTLSSIDEVQAKKFVQLIDETDEVFRAGAGRSGLQMKGFAMCLMYMGVVSYVAEETCTPDIKEGGVLVVCSGSGETKSLVDHATKTKEMGAQVAFITADPSSSIANMADVTIEVSAPSPKSAKQGDIKSIQPMESLFEQSGGISMDVAVVMLMERRGRDSDMMFGRHANME